MLSAAAVGAGCDAGPVLERPAECWLGLVAHLRGDLGDAGVAGSPQPLCALHPPAGQVLQGRPAGEPGEPRREGRSGQSRLCGESRHRPRRPGVLADQPERRAGLRAGKRAEPAVATWRQAGYVRRGSLRRAPWLIRQPIRTAGESSWRPSLTVTGLRSDAVQDPPLSRGCANISAHRLGRTEQVVLCMHGRMAEDRAGSIPASSASGSEVAPIAGKSGSMRVAAPRSAPTRRTA